jgi:hypothetical protein
MAIIIADHQALAVHALNRPTAVEAHPADGRSNDSPIAGPQAIMLAVRCRGEGERSG